MNILGVLKKKKTDKDIYFIEHDEKLFSMEELKELVEDAVCYQKESFNRVKTVIAESCDELRKDIRIIGFLYEGVNTVNVITSKNYEYAGEYAYFLEGEMK